MSDYIKREDAIFIALQQPFYSLIAEIKQLDGIDIVRCRECRYYHHLYGCQKNDDIDLATNDDDYCSYGERKSDE